MAQSTEKNNRVFFNEGDHWEFHSKEADRQRFNEIIRNIDATCITKFTSNNCFRISQGVSDIGRHGVPQNGYNLEWSLYEVVDKNGQARERGVDNTICTTTLSNGIRHSYVVVPRMNSDPTDPRPCEWTIDKSRSFKDINDPRVIVMARGYCGAVSVLSKCLTNSFEKTIRDGYKITTDNPSTPFARVCSTGHIENLLSLAIQEFVPNENNVRIVSIEAGDKGLMAYDQGFMSDASFNEESNFVPFDGENIESNIVKNDSAVSKITDEGKDDSLLDNSTLIMGTVKPVQIAQKIENEGQIQA